MVMKSSMVLIMVAVFILTGCGGKTNDEKSASSDYSTEETQETASSSQAATSESSSQSAETSTSTSSTITTTTSSEMIEETNPLAGYTDDQIEYARVWLTIMGTNYKSDLANNEFELNVRRAPAGSPINPYDESSLTFPNETVMISGKYGYQSGIVYSSNHDGSITYYPVPSHFQQPDDQAILKEEEQNILNNAQRINIPTGNPEDIKELIRVMNIEN